MADTGNLLASHPTIFEEIANLPYGETYFHKATGRCSNGRLVVDYIAQASGLPMLDPYLNNTSNFSNGVNFAVAGATALPPAFFAARNIGPLWTKFSLDTQIYWFLKYKTVFCATYAGDCEEHFANSLFLMGEIGGNDYNYPFLLHHSMDEIETFIPLVVQKIVAALKGLIRLGSAKKILVQNNLPIGCSPSYLTFYATGEELDQMGCMPRFNAFAKKSNDLLRTSVAELQVQHPEVKFVFADYYGAALKVLQSPQSFGLNTDVLQVCCGAGGQYNFNPLKPCGLGKTVSCTNPEQYFNWDGIHLTDVAYRTITNLFVDGNFTSPSFQKLCSTIQLN